jgi:hypothetical protein
MASINIKCTSCKEISSVSRTNEIPDEVVSLECNWCPGCPKEPNEDYHEKHIYEEEQFFNPDQLSILF